MECDPIDIVLTGGIGGEKSVCPLLDVVLVVVKAEDFHVGVGAGEDRAKVISDKVPCVLGSVDATLPACRILGLVLSARREECVECCSSCRFAPAFTLT